MNWSGCFLNLINFQPLVADHVYLNHMLCVKLVNLLLCVLNLTSDSVVLVSEETINNSF